MIKAQVQANEVSVDDQGRVIINNKRLAEQIRNEKGDFKTLDITG